MMEEQIEEEGLPMLLVSVPGLAVEWAEEHREELQFDYDATQGFEGTAVVWPLDGDYDRLEAVLKVRGLHVSKVYVD